MNAMFCAFITETSNSTTTTEIGTFSSMSVMKSVTHNLRIQIKGGEQSHVAVRGEFFGAMTSDINLGSCCAEAFLGCRGNQLLSCVPCSLQLYHQCSFRAHHRDAATTYLSLCNDDLTRMDIERAPIN